MDSFVALTNGEGKDTHFKVTHGLTSRRKKLQHQRSIKYYTG